MFKRLVTVSLLILSSCHFNSGSIVQTNQFYYPDVTIRMIDSQSIDGRPSIKIRISNRSNEVQRAEVLCNFTTEGSLGNGEGYARLTLSPWTWRDTIIISDRATQWGATADCNVESEIIERD